MMRTFHRLEVKPYPNMNSEVQKKKKKREDIEILKKTKYSL